MAAPTVVMRTGRDNASYLHDAGRSFDHG